MKNFVEFVEGLETLSAAQMLRSALEIFRERFAVLTSFQDEGMAIIDMAADASIDLNIPLRVMTLDTGRLPAETYDMIERVRERYRIPVEAVVPDSNELAALVTKHGPNSFYEDLAHRRLCCEVRKVRPLACKLLGGVDAYTTGLRRSQTAERAELHRVERDGNAVKLNPLADWSSAEVQGYLSAHQVPRHPLYAKGYGSIGCAPCTRALLPGESNRAGRWWWEQGSAKECGLHFSPEGKAERTVDVLLRDLLSDARA